MKEEKMEKEETYIYRELKISKIVANNKKNLNYTF